MCLWKKWIVEVKYHFFGVGFMGFCVACVKIRFVFHFVNVYSPCNLAGKHKLWASLVMPKRVLVVPLSVLVGTLMWYHPVETDEVMALKQSK